MTIFSVKILTLTLIYVVPILAFLILLFMKNYSPVYLDPVKYLVKPSSVWCKTSLNNQKLCRFKNICYDSQVMSFLFFLDNLSVIKGLSNYEELQTVQLSSVNLHNKFEANISVVNSDYKFENVEFIEKALVFSRFKPDNIMHVIHDDLIPLFLTLEDICLGNIAFCEQNYRLIMHDNFSKGSFFNFYQVFSNHEPIILTQLFNISKILCFAELHMGLVQDSIFYQYGFNQVQGPIENLQFNYSDINRFVSHIHSRLNVKVQHDKRNHVVAVVARKKTRRILNVKNLTEMLKNVFKRHHPEKEIKIITLDLMENQTDIFLNELAQASAFVGMHGAEMIFSLFLRANSTVIELFPYGIQPEVVSFVKPLVKLKYIHFHYISWTNKFRNNSVFHPEADDQHGGIFSLAQEVQEKIINIKKVPAVECCNNPIYLYYMYQDTWIDSTFENFLMTEFEKNIASNIRASQLTEDWFFPSIVSNVMCLYDSAHGLLHISWTPPFNMKANDLLYDVLLLETNSDLKKKILTNNTALQINIPSSGTACKFNIWIYAISQKNNAKSKDFFGECL